ncbi:hypothetical protein B0T17DRAFT_509442 [Bombardia bombarda]|uniref:SET domain-containing protein n=1 Tax=Bombardia bombarda TaxID=252184 RepID=A0AA39WM83_9PEZI|nr:hypothetical protein B0T17DRAFT_509442 [Bombardia bombarda]
MGRKDVKHNDNVVMENPMILANQITLTGSTNTHKTDTLNPTKLVNSLEGFIQKTPGSDETRCETITDTTESESSDQDSDNRESTPSSSILGDVAHDHLKDSEDTKLEGCDTDTPDRSRHHFLNPVLRFDDYKYLDKLSLKDAVDLYDLASGAKDDLSQSVKIDNDEDDEYDRWDDETNDIAVSNPKENPGSGWQQYQPRERTIYDYPPDPDKPISIDRFLGRPGVRARLGMGSEVPRHKYNYEYFFEIRKSKLGGLGAFAVRDLEFNEVILMEKPILKTTHSFFPRDFYKLNADDQGIFMTLNTNSFLVPGGIAVFAIASRFNHACEPKRNVKYAYDNRHGVITFAVCDYLIPAGTELLVTYGGSPASLYHNYGFRCVCGGCKTLTDKDIEALHAEQWGTVL